MAWLYGPIGAGAFSVKIIFFFISKSFKIRKTSSLLNLMVKMQLF
jgi:hypothetical protein